MAEARDEVGEDPCVPAGTTESSLHRHRNWIAIINIQFTYVDFIAELLGFSSTVAFCAHVSSDDAVFCYEITPCFS